MYQPLADKVRPKTLDDVVGQEHILGENGILRRIISSGNIPNMIFYGPSGVGKTTVANVIAAETKRTLYKLNATTASVNDIKDIISNVDTLMAPNGIMLYLDEIQYFNKKQQQSLLEFIETGKITLIASTTENPYFYVYNAILSRSTVFEFKPIEKKSIEKAVKRAFEKCEVEVQDDVVECIAGACGGDVRKAINAVEILCSTNCVTPEYARQVAQKASMKYDREGDAHYDIVSAYQKSMRGSDPDAALHYLARLLEAGDLPSACRRLLVCACEDVGLAYPSLLPIVKSCVDIALQVGLPEARIPLADAVILVCTAPKSNSAYNAINMAMQDIELGNVGEIPRCLQNKHFDGEGLPKGQNYKYPHDFKDHYVKQQYLPDVLKNRKYYEYGDNKLEQTTKAYWDKIK